MYTISAAFILLVILWLFVIEPVWAPRWYRRLEERIEPVFFGTVFASLVALGFVLSLRLEQLWL